MPTEPDIFLSINVCTLDVSIRHKVTVSIITCLSFLL